MNKSILKKMCRIGVWTISPLIVTSLLINGCILIGWFLFWKTPNGCYIPFTKPSVFFYERFLLAIGFIIGVFTTDHED
jgi:hypothetical protein